MGRGYTLTQTGAEVQGILDEVEDKTVYGLATQSEDGLMSHQDKAKLDNLDIPSPGTITPLMDGTGSSGSSNNYSRADHRHPSDTRKQNLIDSNHKLDYSLLSNTPTIPPAQIQSDWNQTNTSARDYIKNKPASLEQIQSDWNQTNTSAKDYIKNKPTIPDELSDLRDDSTHRLVTDTEKSVWDGKYTKPQTGIPASDIASGVIPDVSQFITKTVNDLTNYYTKAQTYTQSEVNSLIAGISGFEYEVVAILPTASASTMHKIYLVPSSNPQTQNVKDEYITLESSGSYSWEQIGSTVIDLSGYVTTSDLNTALADYTTSADLATLLTGYQTKIDATHKLDYSLVANTPTKVSDFTNDSGFITTETDPVFAASAAHNITSSDISNWNSKGTYSKPSEGIPKTDLESSVQTSLGKADTALQSYTETDPTVPSWAKQSTKPTYTASEVGALPATTVIPDDLADLNDDATHRLVTDTQISTWNNKSDFSGSYNDLTNKPTIPAAQVNSDWNASSGVAQILNKPTIPTALSQLTDDSTHRVVTDTEKNTWNGKQAALVSGTNIKTVNNNSLLGSGDISISGGDVNIIEGIKMNNTALTPDANKVVDLGTVITAHQDISGKADKNEMSVSTSGDQTTITLKSGTSATVINSHQSLSGKQDTLVSGTNIKTINGNSVLGSGNLSTFTPIVNHGTGSTTMAIAPNTFHVWGTVNALNLTLTAPTDSSVYNEYMFRFTSGSTPTTLILPSSIVWINEAPEIEANTTYECSIINNLGVIGGASNV